MKLILFLVIIGVKSLITKLAALGLIFFIFLMKDRSLCFAPGRWIGYAAFNFIICGTVISWMNGISIIRQKEVRHRSTASRPFFWP